MSNNDELDELRNRVEQLEETQQKLEQGAIDAQGRTWTVSDLVNVGLTRRQAIQAVGAIAGGASIGAAIYQSVKPAAAQASMSDGDDDVGTPDNRVDVFADGVDANELSTGNLTVDGRASTYHLPTIGSASGTSTSSVSVSFPSPPNRARCLLYVLSESSAGTVEVRINGDGDTNSNYTYWDETGAKSTGATGVPLAVSPSGNPTIMGELVIGSRSRVAITNDTTAAFNSGFAQRGYHEGTGTMNSLEIVAGGAMPEVRIVVYEPPEP